MLRQLFDYVREAPDDLKRYAPLIDWLLDAGEAAKAEAVREVMEGIKAPFPSMMVKGAALWHRGSAVTEVKDPFPQSNVSDKAFDEMTARGATTHTENSLRFRSIGKALTAYLEVILFPYQT